MFKLDTLNDSWQCFLKQEMGTDYFKTLTRHLIEKKKQGKIIYPPSDKVLNAFSYCPPEQLKVVILGQDPYHGANEANGFAFSVDQQNKVPPSLKNIFKELDRSIESFNIPLHGDLTHWAEQGVLLLNTVLTVEQAKAHSHAKIGWETFTDQVISLINDINPHCVFMLWGAHAQAKGKNINREKHLVLESVHPSPLSAYRGFLGCNHFVDTNHWLKEKKIKEIDWCFKEDITLDLFDAMS